MFRNILLIFTAIVLALNSSAQSSSDTSHVNQKELRNVILFESLTAVTTLVGLSVLWYADYPQSSFHFINDNSEWLQMDKFGHTTASYYIGKTGYELLRIQVLKGRKLSGTEEPQVLFTWG